MHARASRRPACPCGVRGCARHAPPPSECRGRAYGARWRPALPLEPVPSGAVAVFAGPRPLPPPLPPPAAPPPPPAAQPPPPRARPRPPLAAAAPRPALPPVFTEPFAAPCPARCHCDGALRLGGVPSNASVRDDLSDPDLPPSLTFRFPTMTRPDHHPLQTHCIPQIFHCISLDEDTARERAVRAAEREVETLRAELQAVERTRDGALRENRRLQDDLVSAAQDVRQAHREREQARDEADCLKRRLQECAAENQRIEELLTQTENERTEMLERFRGLSVEATMLETNNRNIESEAAENKQQLKCAEERISDLEQQLEMRESLVQSYGNQITELTASIASLENQLQQLVENKKKTDADLDALRDLCVKLDSQKDALQQQLNNHNVVKIQWDTEMTRWQDEQDILQEHLSKDRASIATLENMLALSRQETAEQRHQNEQLKAEVERLQLRVDTLQSKLDADMAELHRFQNQAIEYSQQIKELQQQINNEHFERARGTEENRMTDPRCPCPAKVTLQPCPAIIPGNPPPPLIPYGGPHAARAADWNKKVLAPCGNFPPCATPPCVRKKPVYMTPAPSTDWMAFRTSGFPPTNTRQLHSLWPGMANSKSTGPVSSQARATYMTGPRANSPLMAPPVPGELTTQDFYFCNKHPCPYGNVLREPPFVPSGMHVKMCSGSNQLGQIGPPLVEKPAGGDASAKCCPCPILLPDSAPTTDKPSLNPSLTPSLCPSPSPSPSPSAEPSQSTSAAPAERRGSSSESHERSLVDILQENRMTDSQESVPFFNTPEDNHKNDTEDKVILGYSPEELASSMLETEGTLQEVSIRRSFSTPDLG